MNNTTGSFSESHDSANKFRAIRFIVLTTVALTTYFGNTLILVSLRKFSKHLKGTPYILLGNLAVADLLLATGLTLELIGTIFTSLEVNKYFCILKLIITAVSLATSGKLLLFMSFDRFCAIVFPLKHLARSRKKRHRRIKLALVWSLSVLAVCIPTAATGSLSNIVEGCKFRKLIPDGIPLFASAFILLQFVINVVLCLIVMWRLRINTISRQKYKSSMTKCGFLIKIYVIYVMCWFPFVLNSILITISDDKQKYRSVREYTMIPGLMNSAMNWIIYGLANRKLRNAFKHVLFCRNDREFRATYYSQTTRSDKATRRNDRENAIVPSSATCETFA